MRALGPLAGIAIFVLALCSTHGSAQVTRWEIPGGNWQSLSDESKAIDFGVSGAIQIAGFEPTDNITQSLPWESAQPSTGFILERSTANIWNNYPVKESDLPIVDGDPTTSTEDRFKRFGANQTGRRFTLDLGSRFPVSRVAFYPRLQGVNSSGVPLHEDYIRGYELSTSNGLEYGEDNQPIFQVMERVTFTRDSVAVVEFPNQFTRFVLLRVLAKNPFELAEIELYGSGFVPRAEYVSQVIDLGAPTNFGAFTWDTVKLRVDEATNVLAEVQKADVEASIQVRTGSDATPQIFYEITNRFLNELGIVSESEYNSLSADVRGGFEDDQVNWSRWSGPLESPGQVPDVPSPRQWFQFRVNLSSSSITDGIRINNLAIEMASPALASRLFGEISLVDEPEPAGGFASVPVGVLSRFAYDLLVDVQGRDKGIDGIVISTPTMPRFNSLLIGESVDNADEVQLQPEDIIEAADGLTLHFPEITERKSLRVIFDAEVLVQSTFFDAKVFRQAGGELPQPVLPPPRPIVNFNDPNQQVSTNKLQVLTTEASRHDILNIEGNEPLVITPNGDGRNDALTVSYSLTQLLNAVPNGVEVYTLGGDLVHAFREDRGRGSHMAMWDGTDLSGKVVPVGIYIVRIVIEGGVKDVGHTRIVSVVY